MNINEFSSHRAVSLNFPSDKDEVWRKLGLDSEQLQQVKSFIENNLDLIGSGKVCPQKDRVLPRTVTFLQSGHVIIDTDGNKIDKSTGKKLEMLEGQENERRGWDATTGQLCVIKEVAKENLIKGNLERVGIYSWNSNQYVVLEKQIQSQSKEAVQKQAAHQPTQKPSQNLNEFGCKVPMSDSGSWKYLGLEKKHLPEFLQTVNDNILKFPKNKTVEQVAGKWLARPVTVLENGHVIIHTNANKEGGWGKGGTITGEEKEERVWDATSGDLCVVKTISEADYQKFKLESDGIKYQDHLQVVGTLGRDGDKGFKVVFKAIEETPNIPPIEGQWVSIVPQLRPYSYNTANEPENKPGLHIKFPDSPNADNGNGVTNYFAEKTGKIEVNENTKKTHSQRCTSFFWKSEQLENISGISFTGTITKQKPAESGLSVKESGMEENEIAIFFHGDETYDGTNEYGWIFRENSDLGLFYTLTNANITNEGRTKGQELPQDQLQNWRQWPEFGGIEKAQLSTVKESGHLLKEEELGDAVKMQETKCTWTIRVLKNGDFLVEIEEFGNPDSKKSLLLKNPPDKEFEGGMHGKTGFITITCQKKRNNPKIAEQRELHMDEVKILQE